MQDHRLRPEGPKPHRTYFPLPTFCRSTPAHAAPLAAELLATACGQASAGGVYSGGSPDALPPHGGGGGGGSEIVCASLSDEVSE